MVNSVSRDSIRLDAVFSGVSLVAHDNGAIGGRIGLGDATPGGDGGADGGPIIERIVSLLLFLLCSMDPMIFSVVIAAGRM